MTEDSRTRDTSSDSSARPRRLRSTPALRNLVRETRIDVEALIHPMFVTTESGSPHPISAMPGQSRWPVDKLDGEIESLRESGIRSVLLFGLPDMKDALGSGAADPKGPVPRAITRIKKSDPKMLVVADVCMCEYTDHGHCGVLDVKSGSVDNDSTLPLLAAAACAYADAGADIVAPSAMMDRQVFAIREALDRAGHHSVAIMGYSAKYASGYYGPFREAAGSTPSFGDRRAYQMDSGNAREAVREARLDVHEGADIIMVKPAGPYLDIIRRVSEALEIPLAAYQVSGEYAMIKAAAERGWIDEKRIALESLLGIRRAGADIIITYFARNVAEWLRSEE